MRESPKDRATLANWILNTYYANEPCRICGETITREDITTAVFAGYGKDSSSRSAHVKCWKEQPPVEKWAIQ